LSIFHEKSANEFEDAGGLKTQVSAKTMALILRRGRFFFRPQTFRRRLSVSPVSARSAS
jgi:hypothetical protein